ncbi:MAG: glycosyltransferase family 2 protein [Pseudomonadota bacterium]
MSSVDVIVPCYNYGKYLRQCVESVLAQEGVDVRVLVIDDASQDDTPAVATDLSAKDARVSYRRHERNLRHIATYNEGIEWVSAQYYLLLSADDFLLPGALRRAAEMMDAEPALGFCYGAAYEVFPDGRLERALAEFAPTDGDRSDSMAGRAFIELCCRHGSMNIVSTPTAVVRTSLQKRTDGYRPDLTHTGDLELWMRLAAHAKVGYVGVPQATYRRHASNMSLAYIGANRIQDLRQREQAVNWLIRSCAHMLPDAHALQQSLLKPLAYQAASCASVSLNAGRPDVAGEFIDFAKSVFPGVVFSTTWLRLSCKKLIGRRASGALLSARDAVRRMAG